MVNFMKYKGKLKLKRKYSPHYTEKKPLFSEKEIIFRSAGNAMVLKISSKIQVFALVAFALAGLLINIFGFKKIHTFAKSVYMGVDNSTTDFVKNAHGAKTWLWVFGVITLVEGFGYFANGKMMLELQCLVNAATYIISAILVNKYLAEEQAQ